MTDWTWSTLRALVGVLAIVAAYLIRKEPRALLLSGAVFLLGADVLAFRLSALGLPQNAAVLDQLLMPPLIVALVLQAFGKPHRTAQRIALAGMGVLFVASFFLPNAWSCPSCDDTWKDGWMQALGYVTPALMLAAAFNLLRTNALGKGSAWGAVLLCVFVVDRGTAAVVGDITGSVSDLASGAADAFQAIVAVLGFALAVRARVSVSTTRNPGGRRLADLVAEFSHALVVLAVLASVAWAALPNDETWTTAAGYAWTSVEAVAMGCFLLAVRDATRAPAAVPLAASTSIGGGAP